MWEQPEKSEASTTQPESSSEEEGERPSSRGIASESSDSEDDQVPSKNGWPKSKTPKKRRKAPFYASDGPMHSTPMDTTPDEEPVRAEVVSESSDTGDEDIPTNLQKKEHASFKAAPEIIQDKGVSGSAATSDTAPSVIESTLAKKPLKSALKKPKNPVPLPVVLNEENDEFDSPDKPLGSLDHHHHHHHKHRERPRSRASSGSTDHKEKKRRFRKKSSKKKETLVQIDGEEYRVKHGDTTGFQDSQV